MGSPQRREDADAPDRDGPACARAQPGRSHRGGRHRPRHPARRPALRGGRDGDRQPQRTTDLAAVQPGRRHPRVHEPRRDGDPLGRRVGDTTRDAPRPLEQRPATRLQPRRADPLHGEPRRNRDRLGHDGRGCSRTVVHVHARPRVVDRRARGYEGHPGEFSPDGRLIAVGLQDRGIALLDASELTPVGRSLLGTGGEVKSLAFSPDGRTLAASAFGGVVTLWDVGSRSRLLHDRRVDRPTTTPCRRHRLQPRRKDARHDGRLRREALGRGNRTPARSRSEPGWATLPSAPTGR